MPRKYLAMPNDVFALSSIATIYSMINPIEKKLVAAGYKGPLLADFDNDIYKELGVEDKEATRKLQEQSNEEWEAENKEGEAPKVAPAYKKTADHFIAKGDTFQSEGIGSVIINNNSFTNSDEFTEESDKEFHKYLAKFDKYLDLLISNTPEEEFKEEFTQLRFQKANIRAVKTFGSGQVFSNELGFAWSMEMFDSDLPCIKEPGVPGSGVSRELWKQTYKNYPYGDLLEASTDILNTACDYEENKEKNTYIGQIKYRENYRNAIQGYLDAARSLANDPETAERTIKQIRKEEVIKKLKEFDGPDKDIDYNEIIKRVEEQKKKGQEPNPEDSAIAKKINDIVNKEYKPGDYSEYNTRYAFELKGMGYAPSERDFTGNRGIQLMIPEIEAQLNAIDMGWPMDELVNIQRLTVFLRNNIRPNGKQFSDEQKRRLKKQGTSMTPESKTSPILTRKRKERNSTVNSLRSAWI